MGKSGERGSGISVTFLRSFYTNSNCGFIEVGIKLVSSALLDSSMFFWLIFVVILFRRFQFSSLSFFSGFFGTVVDSEYNWYHHSINFPQHFDLQRHIAQWISLP